MRRSEIAIDLGALRRNVARLREVLGATELWAVVKADGYGHGAVDAANAATDAGAAALCVATVPEGLTLRRVLPQQRILVLGPADARAAVERSTSMPPPTLTNCFGSPNRSPRPAARTMPQVPASVMPRYPQAKENVRVAERRLTPGVEAEVARVNAELGDDGRVLVRPSGTEPVIRVLAEAESLQEAETLCARIAALVRRELG